MFKKYLQLICSLLLLFVAIQPVSAMKYDQGNLAVSVPTPISPSGTIISTMPTFTWSKIVEATQYEYQLFNGKKLVYSVIVAATECGQLANCVNTPATQLGGGSYSWKVHAFVGGIWKSYSIAKAFTYATVPTLISPIGKISDMIPIYSWSKIVGAAQYQYLVFQGTKLVYTKTVVAEACGETANCVIMTGTSLPGGSYNWKARAYVGGAWKTYSAVKGFTVVDYGEMVTIPAGAFKMGCNPVHKGGYTCNKDEQPVHSVTLSAYKIGKFEVTNAQYAQCVAASVCTVPGFTYSYTHPAYYGNSEFANSPVIYVDWNQANAYCVWSGGRLPTEAEWEKAARGPSSRVYPWGDSGPTTARANYNSIVGDTTRVGSYPTGASPYGVMDMAGNVWEWVHDWYGPYSSLPVTNPTGPDTGFNRVLRGGSWYSFDNNYLRTSLRNYNIPTESGDFIGFRCAR